MRLYKNTNSMEITGDIRQAAKEMFTDYSLTFLDLEREPQGESVIRQPFSDQTKTKGLGKLAKIIWEIYPLSKIVWMLLQFNPHTKFVITGNVWLVHQRICIWDWKNPIWWKELLNYSLWDDIQLTLSKDIQIPVV